ncbi:hypothetical protein GCM10007108_13790 [Thermogymnomonas acidicola]|uniref:Uncharacterized protein n=1 Tax=Thermogymnomonas acidicola TaxID=399579 RepID=A0AA37F9R7_9ARCH|nr:hypothetical protein GCM10007108_13790 [Thermogymnomonas acidicola]
MLYRGTKAEGEEEVEQPDYCNENCHGTYLGCGEKAHQHDIEHSTGEELNPGARVLEECIYAQSACVVWQMFGDLNHI